MSVACSCCNCCCPLRKSSMLCCISGAANGDAAAQLFDNRFQFRPQLYVRKQLLLPPKHLRLYHAQAKAMIVAEQQAAIVDQLVDSGLLTKDELKLLEWTKGHAAVNPKKRFSTEQQVAAYKKASAFEALVGAAGHPKMCPILHVLFSITFTMHCALLWLTVQLSFVC